MPDSLQGHKPETARMHPMWQLDAYGMDQSARMLLPTLYEAIKNSSDELPGILSEPVGFKVVDIRERVRRNLVLDSEHSTPQQIDQQNALFNLLEEILAQHPKFAETETITTTRFEPPVNHFPRRPDQSIEAIRATGLLIRTFMLTQGRAPHFGGLSVEAQIGLFLAALILRQGLCSNRALSAVVRNMHHRVRMAGEWLYLEVRVEGDSRHPAEHRRIFLDTFTAAIYMRLPIEAQTLAYPEEIQALKPSVQARRLASSMNVYYKALIKEASGSIEAGPVAKSLKSLLACRQEVLSLEVNPVLTEYATGALRSTSFVESAWLRWLGLDATRAHDRTSADSGDVDSGLSEIPADTHKNRSTQLISAEFDTSGTLRRIRQIVRRQKTQRIEQIESLVAELKAVQGELAPETLLALWVRELITKRRRTGKYLSPKTVLYMLGIFGARMLAGFMHSVDRVPDDDELHDIYLGIIEQGVSTVHEGRLASVIRDFDLFIRNHLGRPNGTTLDGIPTSTGHYQISANAMLPSEMDALLSLIDGPESTLTSEHAKNIAAVVVDLAFRLGLRRAEVLALLRSDVHQGRNNELIIRDNEFRTLKTSNSRRRVPLGLLPWSQFCRFDAMLENLLPDGPIFSDSSGMSPIPDHLIMPQLKRMFFRVTGDASVHFHHLRHSAASWSFMALMSDQVPVHRYIEWAPFFQDILNSRQTLENYLVSSFRPVGSRAFATCDLLGHGDPTTTFMHYIHILDLLLFMALDPGQEHGDQQLLLAAVGFSEKSRLTDYSPSMVLADLIRTHEARVLVHADKQQDPDDQDAAPHTLSFDALVAHWEGSEKPVDLPPVPGHGAPRQAAATILNLINKKISERHNQARVAIQLLAEKRIKNSDWSSVNVEQLEQIASGLAAGDITDFHELVEAKLVVYGPKKQRQFVALERAALEKLLTKGENRGKIWVRLHDARPRSSGQRPSAENRKRQKTQSSVTWTVLAVNHWWVTGQGHG